MKHVSQGYHFTNAPRPARASLGADGFSDFPDLVGPDAK